MTKAPIDIHLAAAAGGGLGRPGVPSDLAIYQRIAAAIFEQRLECCTNCDFVLNAELRKVGKRGVVGGDPFVVGLEGKGPLVQFTFIQAGSFWRERGCPRPSAGNGRSRKSRASLFSSPLSECAKVTNCARADWSSPVATPQRMTEEALRCKSTPPPVKHAGPVMGDGPRF